MFGSVNFLASNINNVQQMISSLHLRSFTKKKLKAFEVAFAKTRDEEVLKSRTRSSVIIICAECMTTILSLASSSSSSSTPSLSRTRSLTLELKAEALGEKRKLLPYLHDCQIYCSSEGESSRAAASSTSLCSPLSLPPFWCLTSAFSTTAERQKGSRFQNNWRAFVPTVVNVSSFSERKRIHMTLWAVP